MNRTEQIKGYLKRLGDGESLENVKKDFVKEFNYGSGAGVDSRGNTYIRGFKAV